ncbi:TPA: helix-turn-helix domain-containing protein [Escherichia coli]|nr:helix-turn-helix domain-containing protein [Escherichia coli]
MKSDDRLLFLGNPQQSVPKRLLLARNLSPRDKFTWQLLRLHARDDGSGVFPSYNELQGWLSDQPEGEKASRSTVSNALMMLRITRWLSLCQRLRDEQSGRITGNLYALHDAPLTHADACRMDSEYLALLTACSRHRNRHIRTIAIGLLLTLQQPVESGRTCTESPLKTAPGLNRGLSKKCPSLQLRLSDVAGAGGQSEPRCVHTGTDLNNKHQKRTQLLHWPVDNPFSASERRAAERAMRNLDPALCQQVLDDCLWRIATHDIHRPLAYLLATLEKARRGEFNQLRRMHR